MCSRSLLVLLLILNQFFNLGCGLKIGEKNQSVDVVEVKSAQCLEKTIGDLKLYFVGNASDDQVSTSVSCLQDVFIAFKENIRGQDKKSYTAKEIAVFIETNFLTESNTHFSDDFLLQLMKFKVALIGGNSDVVQKPEIDLLVDFLARYKTDFVQLNQYMKILTLHWLPGDQPQDADLKEKNFIDAKKQFYSFIQKLSNEFAGSGRVYQIDDLIGFIYETAKFASSSEDTLVAIKKASNFLKKFKIYLIGGNTSLNGNEWTRLGLTLHEAYFQALRFEYFLKDLDENQIDRKWQVYEKMASDLTSLIEKLLDAKETQSLSNSEIFDLLQPLSQLIPEAGVDEELLNDLGEMKVMVLGGSSIGKSGWSRDDFNLLNKKIPKLFSNLSKLVQTIDYLSLNKNDSFRSQVTYDQFIQAEVKILDAVGGLSQEVENSYDLSSFRKLLIDLSNGPFKNILHLPDNFESIFNLAISAKTTLTGHSGVLLSKEDLYLVMNAGVRFYLNYTEYDLFIKNLDIKKTEYILALQRLTAKVRNTFLYEIDLREGHSIFTNDLSQLILTLQTEQIIKTQFKSAGLEAALNGLWSHVFNNPDNRLHGDFRKGLDYIIVEQLFSEVNMWLIVQQNITEIFAQNENWSAFDLRHELKRRILMSTDSAGTEGLNELYDLINEDIALTFNSNNYLQILNDVSSNYSFDDLNKSNFSRAASRVAIRAYAGDIERVNKLAGVLLSEASFAFTQFKQLAIDLELIDPSNTSFIDSRFREANLFLSNSNGDNLAQFGELHHLVLHIFSGIERAKNLKVKILKNCISAATTTDLNTEPSVSEDCLLETYFNEEEAFAGMPQFIKMRSLFTKEDIKLYYFSLLKTAGHIPNESHVVHLIDADLFPHVVQYIEMVYARHDSNHDGFLQKDEALAAFPVFKDLLKELVKSYKQIKEEDLPGVFIYILKNGRPPRKESIAEVLKFIAFIRDKTQKDWNIQSTRIDLGKIFNYIADATKPTEQLPPNTSTPIVSPDVPNNPVVAPSGSTPAPQPQIVDLNLVFN